MGVFHQMPIPWVKRMQPAACRGHFTLTEAPKDRNIGAEPIHEIVESVQLTAARHRTHSAMDRMM
eukprot:5525364-Amphidinium_carterae.2